MVDTVLVADASPRRLAQRVDQLAGLPVRVEAVNTLDDLVDRVARSGVHVVVAGSSVSPDGPAAVVRAVHRACDPPPIVVAVLARSEVLATDAAVAAGADDVLVTPFDASLLANKVEVAVKLGARRSRGSDRTPWPAATDAGAERRRFVRQSLCEPIRLREPGGEAFQRGSLLDVSESAARFQAQVRMRPADWVELDCPFLVHLLDWGPRRLLTRVIRRVGQRPANVYAASLVGIGEGETQRMRRWIFAEQTRRVRVAGTESDPGPPRAAR